jgi:hypothetical protein
MDKAPWLVQQVLISWKLYNPDWDIRVVTEQNLSNYIDVPYLTNVKSFAAKSDIIRLSLLAKYGGIWVDSTLLCMKPLDDYIGPLLEPIDFWMYHGNENGPCSWFIVSSKDSYLIQEWKKACDLYWKNERKEAHHYFWMDLLFRDLMKKDKKFLELWEKVPYINCKDIGESHMFTGQVTDYGSVHSNDADLKYLINVDPPHVLKLSHHNFDANDMESNGMFAINKSLGKM